MPKEKREVEKEKKENKWKRGKKVDKHFRFEMRLIDTYPENKSNGQYLLSCCTSWPLTCYKISN